MKFETISKGDIEAVKVQDDGLLLTDTQSVLDLIATARYETGCDRLIIFKDAIAEDFFELRTGIAGEILQKIVNYGFKLAIVGDFSGYASKSLRDFIVECNRGRDIFFVSDENEAIAKLCV